MHTTLVWLIGLSGIIANLLSAFAPTVFSTVDNHRFPSFEPQTPGFLSPSLLAQPLALLQPPLCPAEPSITPIAQIQGSGPTSPFVGQTVFTEGVVVGDFQASGQLNGFFLQDPQGDANPVTSEGVFVFHTGNPVRVGDYVRLRGRVQEVGGGSTTLTQLTNVNSFTNCASNQGVNPTPVSFPVTSPTLLEQYEGMLVQFPQTLTVSDTSRLVTFGELVLSFGRLYHPNNGNGFGDSVATNPLRRIVLDDANTTRFPSPIPYLSATGVNGTRRAGDTVSNLRGVLSHGFGSYRLQPVSPVTFTSANPRSSAPEAVGGSLKVAAYNVLNYFTVFGGDRGASNQAEFERQQAKLVAAIEGLGADIVGLIEIQNNADTALNSLVAALNTRMGANTYAAIQTGNLGSDVIKVALIYKPAKVVPEGPYRMDSNSVYSRTPLAQMFRDPTTQGRFTVVVNHFKSKGCDGANGENLDTGQGCYNARRILQARQLLGFIEQLKATDPDVLAIGDFNANGEEDPMDILSSGGLENLTLRIPAGRRYSYIYQSEAGSLDHVLATPSLASQVSGISDWHINADEPQGFDFNLEAKTDDRFAPSPFRSSDHDPVLVGLSLTAEGGNNPDFTVRLNPESASLQPGQSLSATLSLNPLNGFNSVVSLSLSPINGVGISASVSPVSITPGQTATLQVSTTAAVQAGSYPLNLTATSGALSKTASFNLAVGTAPAACVRISQIYGGGGNSGAIFRNDFIELFNCGISEVNLSGWSVQYAAAGGSIWQVTPLSGSLVSGGYSLVGQARGTGGTQDLPAPDISGVISMATAAGKVALSRSAAPLSGQGLGNADVVDFVGYGTAASAAEGSPTTNLANTLAAVRKGEGCIDTKNNRNDFVTASPSPRNRVSPSRSCVP